MNKQQSVDDDCEEVHEKIKAGNRAYLGAVAECVAWSLKDKGCQVISHKVRRELDKCLAIFLLSDLANLFNQMPYYTMIVYLRLMLQLKLDKLESFKVLEEGMKLDINYEQTKKRLNEE